MFPLLSNHVRPTLTSWSSRGRQIHLPMQAFCLDYKVIMYMMKGFNQEPQVLDKLSLPQVQGLVVHVAPTQVQTRLW